jgi:sugar-specific transcriptional regulator TrmB
VSLKEHAEKVLQELGLTFSQAKLFVALVRLSECATANEISSYSNVARQDVYRLMEGLQEIGLVEKVVSNPAKFKAIPIRDATSFLVKKRKEKTHALVEESTALLTSFPELTSSTGFQDSHQFMLIPKREAVIRRIEKAIKAADEKILIITPWREFTQWMFTLHDLWQQTIKRGVTIHWITETKPRDPDSHFEMLRNFMLDPHFKLRTLHRPVNSRLGVYDHREVFIATTINNNAAESPALWTNSPTMINVLEDYFEMKWKLAAEYEFKGNQVQEKEKRLIVRKARAANSPTSQ